MTSMIEKIFSKQPQEERSPYVDMEGFDPQVVREMEDEYIRLGYITENDRMPIPREIEFPNEATALEDNAPTAD